MTTTLETTTLDATTLDATTSIPGYQAGTWVVDPVHSEVSFTVRHLMVSKVRGRFARFDGVLVTAANPLDSSVEARVDLSSIDTGNADRDAHVRSADFLDVEQFPELTYRSIGIRAAGDGFVVDGELSLHGVTQQVLLELEVNGFQANTPMGDNRVGFSARAEIDRTDFGVEFNAPLDNGGVMLGNKIQITLEVEAVLQPEG
jgi:polyisoprenoid-binding protein YceI